MPRGKSNQKRLFLKRFESKPRSPKRQPYQPDPDLTRVKRIDLLRAGQFPKLYLDPSEPLAKEPDSRGKQAQSRRANEANLKSAANPFISTFRRLFCLFYRLQYSFSPFQKGSSRVGECDSPGAALEELDP